MFQPQFTRLTDFLVEEKLCKLEDRELIIHGFCGGIELIFNIVTTFFLGIVFNMLLESFVFIIFYSFIRTYAGGYHCEKASACYLFSSGIVIVILALVKFTPYQYIFISSAIILLVSVPILLKYAPIETPTKPLDTDEKKCFGKKMIRNLIIELLIIS